MQGTESAAAQALLPPNPALGSAQRQDAIRRLQRTHGNAYVARLLASPSPVIQRLVVREGSRGSAVRDVQEALNHAIPAPKPPLAVDGIFGSETEKAVIAFQTHHGLKPDGIAGRRTWGALAGSPTAPKETAHAAAPTDLAKQPQAPAKQAPVQSSAAKLVAAAENVVEEALSLLAGQPDDGALPPDFVEERLTAYFEEFSAIPVTVKGTTEKPVTPPRVVRVHPPYFINANENSAALSQEVFAAAEKARGQKAVRKFFSHVGSSKSGLGGWNALHGKATPENLRDILQEALDQGLIQPQDADHPTALELETWLRTHGVGVDCSGFVAQALNKLVAQGRAQIGEEGPSPEFKLGSTGTGSLKGSSKGFASVGADKSCTGPQCLQPGDTMSIKGHVRIVASVEQRDGGVEFSTFESAAGGKKRIGLTQASWFYPDKGKFTKLEVKRDEDAPWKPTSEKPTFARYGALADLEAAPAK